MKRLYFYVLVMSVCLQSQDQKSSFEYHYFQRHRQCDMNKKCKYFRYFFTLFSESQPRDR